MKKAIALNIFITWKCKLEKAYAVLHSVLCISVYAVYLLSMFHDV